MSFTYLLFQSQFWWKLFDIKLECLFITAKINKTNVVEKLLMEIKMNDRLYGTFWDRQKKYFRRRVAVQDGIKNVMIR